MRILVADDDPQIVRALRLTLQSVGYEIVTAADGPEAIRLAASTHPDIVMLDLGMPALDGVDVIRAVRGWSDVPILVVSGRTGSADKVEALDAGADDYVTKPFAIDELLARLRALGRRRGGIESVAVLRIGECEIDLAAKAVLRGGERVRLTPTEWRILEQLARAEGRLVTRAELLTELWGTAEVRDTGYLRIYIAQLRKKLEPDPASPTHILTEAGMGYRLVADA
ncbi:response regulator transcription factor [Agrococcus sp. ARC_14]|uniref:response regulator n=1 Tax=Agrococcus sp. ARC_14 TaxID=2919927 RepID=UPI001F0560F3|nr:response regulator transcription factor [Agrococcus sp. ARC_14]MCH1881687.1 response regulator transcription factor [Agrococcus sp. ARC_14]